jgi:hypothetical protein
MKRILFLTLILALALSSLCFAETVPFAPKAVHTIWNLPWGLTPEEFCQKAQETQSLTFTKASEYLSQSVYTLQGGPATILGYPADVKVIFTGDPQVSSLVQFHFLTWDAKTPVSYALNMLGGLYESISAQYGQPGVAYLMGYNRTWQVIPFALPMESQNIRIDRLLPLYQSDRPLPSCSMQFDNVALVLFPSSDDGARPNATDGTLEAAFALWVEACSPEKAKELSVPAKLEPFDSYAQLTQQDE